LESEVVDVEYCLILIKNFGKMDKFLATKDTSKEVLDEYGVVIIPDVIDKEE
jgi:hypothetical protein